MTNWNESFGKKQALMHPHMSGLLNMDFNQIKLTPHSETCLFVTQSAGHVEILSVLFVCLDQKLKTELPPYVSAQAARVSKCLSDIPTAADHRDSPTVASAPASTI